MNISQKRASLILSLAFFLSGAAGLIYQVVWARYLGLLLGGTGIAQVIVLSTFMGGLGLGAWLIGRLADRVDSSINLFIVLELGIALYAGLFPMLFLGFRWAFFGLAQGLEPGGAAVLTLKTIVAVLAILPPTVLMGGTLPVLGKYVIDRLSLVGRRVAFLYYINSFGAVAGTFLAGFWLIEAYGLHITILVGAALDLAVAIIAIGFRERAFDPKNAPVDPRDPAPNIPASLRDETERYSTRLVRTALVVIGLSGAVSMIYEVAWIRMLTLVLGGSTYSFTLMVGAFISGISLGSFLLSRRKSDRDFYALLGYQEIFIGIGVLATLPIYMELPFIFNQMQGLFRRTEATFYISEAMKLAICFLVMLGPTIFIGMTLPTASKIAAKGMKSLGGDVGAAFAVNTFGTLIGAAVAGALLLPMVGIQGALKVGVALNILLGAVLLATSPRSRRPALRYAMIFTLAACVATGFTYSFRGWSDSEFARGVFRLETPFISHDQYREFVEMRYPSSNEHYGELAYQKDGMDATVSVISLDDGGRILSINGKADASVGVGPDHYYDGDMPTQLLLAHLAMLHHPGPKSVLVVGQGSGVTVGALAAYPDVEIDLVELSPEVVETAPHFSPENREFYNRPNVNVIIEDARTLLALTEKTYDVIVCEPSNPWMGGNAALFTVEFFEACAKRLAQDGVFVQWLHYYEMNDDSVLLILNAYRQQFPHLSMWEMSYGDLALVGRQRSFTLDFDRFERWRRLDNVATDLENLALDIPEVFLGRQILDVSESGRDFVGKHPLNSEIHPTLEYEAAKGFYLQQPAPVVGLIDGRGRPKPWSPILFNRYERSQDADMPTPEDWRRAYEASKIRDSVFSGEPRQILRLWGKDHPDDLHARMYAWADSPEAGNLEKLRRLREPVFDPIKEDSDYIDSVFGILEEFIMTSIVAEEFPDDLSYWLDWLRATHASRPDDPWRYRALMGRILILQGEYREASMELTAAIRENNLTPDGLGLLEATDILRLMTACFIAAGDLEFAVISLGDYAEAGDFFSIGLLHELMENAKKERAASGQK